MDMKQNKNMDIPAKKERTPLWDNVRGILIFLVVVGHLYEKYNVNHGNMAKAIFNYIYLFHMPVFLFISGMFSKRTIKEGRWNKVLSMLALYFLLTFILGIARMLFSGNYLVSFFSYKGLTWYAFVLFTYGSLSIICEKLKIPHRYVMVCGIVFGCMCGYDKDLNDTLVLLRGFNFFPFYYAGYLVNENKLLGVSRKKVVRIACAAGLLLAALICYLQAPEVFKYSGFFTGRHSYEKLLGDRVMMGGLYRLLCYGISTLMGFMLISVTPDKKISVLTRQIGSHTLQIYAFHYVLIYFFRDFIKIEAIFKKIWPAHFLYLYFPLAILITFLCSFEFLGKGIDMMIRPSAYPKIWGGSDNK